MVTVLIAEDDESLRTVMADKIAREYSVFTANDGVEALSLLQENKIDLVVADIMMPRMDGYELVENIRRDNEFLPVLMVTAKHDFASKSIGFNVGIDDYMEKPVNFDELMLRIKALLRRAKISADREIRIGAFSMNATTFEVLYGNSSIELKRREFELLFTLLSYPNKLFSKDKLMETVWGIDCPSDDNTIRTHINWLRNKLSAVTEFEIITVKGIGYKAVIKDEALR